MQINVRLQTMSNSILAQAQQLAACKKAIGPKRTKVKDTEFEQHDLRELIEFKKCFSPPPVLCCLPGCSVQVSSRKKCCR